MQNTTKNHGFSILEMTIAITIIAMVVAAITAGSNLKTKLELNQVIDDVGNITSAVKSFKTTYNGLAGDLSNAEDALGVTATDNGNGNNFLGSAEGTGTNKNETLLFWQHLQLAGLIDGTYDGVTDDVGGRMQTAIKRGLFGVRKTSGTTLNISVSKASAYGILTTKQAYNIDAKYDDSNPSTGTIRAADGTGETAQNCVTTSGSTSYTLSNSNGTPCVLYFYIEQ